MSDVPGLFTEEEVVQRLGLSRSTLRRLRLSGMFPEPLRLGKRRMAWTVTQIVDWLATRQRSTEARRSCPVTWYPTGGTQKVFCRLLAGHDGLHVSPTGHRFESEI